MSQAGLIIKNLIPGLTERGKIKIGERGRFVKSAQGRQFQPPQKLDHFRVVTLERGPDGNYVLDREVHDLYGDRPRELPVRLLYDDIPLNFQCRYVCFLGRTMWCHGDGERAWRLVDPADSQRTEVPCPCGRQDPTYGGKEPCKISSRLSCIIDGVERVGGVWVLRTTSYNSTVGILSSLSLIKRITAGPLAGIPLVLTLNPKTVIVPTSGKTQLVWVVGVEFRGSIQQLQEIGYEQAKADALHMARIERIEEEARRMLVYDPVGLVGEEDEFVEEFVPEQVIGEVEDGDTTNGAGSDDDRGASGDAGGRDSERRGEASEGAQDIRSPGGDLASPGKENGGNAKSEGAPQSPTRRSRRNRFEVDPEEWDGLTEIKTCGATPEQIRRLQVLAREFPRIKDEINKTFKEIGYDRLTFLREDEAARLIEINPAPPPPEEALPLLQGELHAAEDMPDDLVECPINGGDKMSRSNYCRVRCPVRHKDGFCPILGEDPPVKEVA